MRYTPDQLEQWRHADLEADRALTPEQRLSLALDLFDIYRQTMLDVLRAGHPQAEQHQIEEMFRRRLEDDRPERAVA